MNRNNPERERPVLDVILAGNLMAAALERPESYDSTRLYEIIAAWNGSVDRLRQARNNIRSAAIGLATSEDVGPAEPV